MPVKKHLGNATGPKIFLSVLLLLFFLHAGAAAQEHGVVIDAWERGDITPFYVNEGKTAHPADPLSSLGLAAIRFYQKDISCNSVSRCPFSISCSNYAKLAVEKHGLLLGVCYFIDRTYYRENIHCYRNYKLIENDDGILKLDDSYYLTNGK